MATAGGLVGGTGGFEGLVGGTGGFEGLGAGRVTAKTNAAVWKIVERLDEAKAAEFAVCLVRMAMKQHKPFAASKEFVTWAQKHKALVGCA